MYSLRSARVRNLKAYKPGDFPDPSQNLDLQVQVWKGMVEASMMEVFRTSQEKFTHIVRKPTSKVVVTKGFKSGAFQLAALTQNVTIGSEKSMPKSAVASSTKLGTLFQHDGVAINGYVKSCLRYPQESTVGSAQKAADVFIAAYWVVETTNDPSDANCKRDTKTVSIKVGATCYSVEVPIIVNTKELAAGDELTCYCRKPEIDVGEPEAKKQRVNGKAGKAVGKSSKGAGKAKSKSK
jgi:hypothetical protein